MITARASNLDRRIAQYAQPRAHPATAAPPAESPSGPKLVESTANAGLLALCKLEEDARNAATRNDLDFVIANETLRLLRARQIFVFHAAGGDVRMAAISGLQAIDRSAPLVQRITSLVRSMGRRSGLNDIVAFDHRTFGGDGETALNVYPFPALLWVPFLSRERELLGGMLLASEQDWVQEHKNLANRLAATFAHALALLLAEARPQVRFSLRTLAKRKVVLLAAAAAVAALAFPVSMTTLAPFEIVPREPFVVAAPIDGVIRSVLVEPSNEVKTEQALVQFTDTVLRNRLEVAEQEMLVAEARLKKATQLAFEDSRGRQELGLAMAEVKLKTTERNFARALFEQGTIKATRSGVAVYSDKQALLGKPVVVGERIMLIADPTQIEVAIDVSVSDAIALKPGARVKIFLDSDPMNSREAQIVSADYMARVRPGNTLAFRVVAKLVPSATPLPRLGTRGTAQLYGDNVWLGFYLFRRPVSALRQWIGL